MKNRLASVARQVVKLEKQIQRGEDKEAAEAEIETLMEKLTPVEMLALEDYICSKKLI